MLYSQRSRGIWTGWEKYSANLMSGGPSDWTYWGYYRAVEINGTTVLLFKSNTHLDWPGATFLIALIKLLAAEVQPSLHSFHRHGRRNKAAGPRRNGPGSQRRNAVRKQKAAVKLARIQERLERQQRDDRERQVQAAAVSRADPFGPGAERGPSVEGAGPLGKRGLRHVRLLHEL